MRNVKCKWLKWQKIDRNNPPADAPIVEIGDVYCEKHGKSRKNCPHNSNAFIPTIAIYRGLMDVAYTNVCIVKCGLLVARNEDMCCVGGTPND